MVEARSGPGRLPGSAGRWLPLAEALLLWAAILVHIWVVEPLGGPAARAGWFLVILAIAAVIYRTRGDDRRRIGLRVDNLRGAARLILPPTLVAGGLLLALGALLGTLRFSAGLLAALALYPLWGLLQQYALQGIVQLRLEEGGAGAFGPPAAAALFALVHTPNPLLMGVTFVAGWGWCHAFRRRPNLLILALSHGWLATFLFAALPPAVTGGLRIGPDYLHYVAAHLAAR